MDNEKHMSVSAKMKEWRKMWYTGPGHAIEALKRRYGYDKAAYFAAFRPDDRYIMDLQEEGMQYFAKIEARLAREMRLRSLKLAGEAACKILVAALTNRNTMPNDPGSDFILASLDFEGTCRYWGIKEAGITTLDSRDLLLSTQATDDSILRTNKHELGRHKRKYLHGEAIRTHLAQLPEILRASFTIHDDTNGIFTEPRKVVLVGHGIHNEIRELDDLGIVIEEHLPWVVGIVDTADLGSRILGRFLKLGDLLHKLDMQVSQDCLHDAGNDSNYTMRALLTLLYRQADADLDSNVDDKGIIRRLDEIARAPLARPRVMKVEAQEDEDKYELFSETALGMFA